MNKSDLIAALSTKENLTEKNAFEIINMIFFLPGFAIYKEMNVMC